MNKEEIIIDGVNVSECPEYSKYIEGYCGWYMPCKQEGSCSFKLNWLKSKLQRLKVENEELGKIIQCKTGTIATLVAIRDELKEENKSLEIDLKEALKQLEFSRTHKTVLETETERLKAENEKLKEKFKIVFNIDNQDCWNIAFLNEENARYKQALEEIKTIAGNRFVSGLNEEADCYRESKNMSKIKLLSLHEY